MHFAFAEEHELFRDTIRALLADVHTPAAIRESWDSDDGQVAPLWQNLTEMGALGVLAPESLGGLGMDETGLVLLLEEAGYACVSTDFADHVAVAVPALAEADHPDAAAAAGGEKRFSLALGPGRYIAGGQSSNGVIARRGDSLVLVDSGAINWSPTDSIDSGRRIALGQWDSGAEQVLEGADSNRAFDRYAMATAAQAVGVSRYLLDATVAYVSERHQFGKPVGSYQAVKHHLANVRLGIEFSAPLVYRAAWCIAVDNENRSRDVSAAKVHSSDTVDFAARQALQCHGAIGYTDEYELQMWLKRAWVLASTAGDARWHRDRVAVALGLLAG